MRANPHALNLHTEKKGISMSMPFTPPFSMVNSVTLRPFNFLYYHLNARKTGQKLVHYEPFSYPLDNLNEWNRMYGPRGFYQYQSVIPLSAGLEATRAMLKAIKNANEGSFLAVLKTFGNKASQGMLSFPMPGVTLALDFPNRGERTQRLFRQLDAIVSEAGGRLYPAKDARMPKDLFQAGYPQLSQFRSFRDPGISSGFSRRVMGD